MLDRKEVREKLRGASSNEALYQVVLDEQNGQ
jgi:PTS system nitrogen regulatory IIA component